jgi:hypothetical protein
MIAALILILAGVLLLAGSTIFVETERWMWRRPQAGKLTALWLLRLWAIRFGGVILIILGLAGLFG